MKSVSFLFVPAGVLITLSSVKADLFNVDFSGAGPSLEKGWAATGQTTNDFWNSYTNRNSDGSFQADGALSNLKNAAGAASNVGLTVTNGAGAWALSTSGPRINDPMFDTYIYPLAIGNLSITVTNLPSGIYNFYLYSIDSSFNLEAGGADFGTDTTYEYPIVSPPPWVSGKQFVTFSGVWIGPSQPATVITVSAGQRNPAIISGMQIESASGSLCTPHAASAVAQIVNGFAVGATLTDAGCGYTNTPNVWIRGGGGTGATAVAIVQEGFVVGITITDAGIGYINSPSIIIDPPPFSVQSALVKAVKPVFSGLMVSSNYQLQVSTDLKTWTNSGTPFNATNTTIGYPQYWDVDDWNQLFFRVQAVP